MGLEAIPYTHGFIYKNFLHRIRKEVFLGFVYMSGRRGFIQLKDNIVVNRKNRQVKYSDY